MAGAILCGISHPRKWLERRLLTLLTLLAEVGSLLIWAPGSLLFCSTLYPTMADGYTGYQWQFFV